RPRDPVGCGNVPAVPENSFCGEGRAAAPGLRPENRRRHRGGRGISKKVKKELLKVSVGRRSRLVAVRDKIRATLDYLEIPRLVQNRLIIALSEVIRNTIQYAREGLLVLSVEGEYPNWKISFVLSDKGPGI